MGKYQHYLQMQAQHCTVFWLVTTDACRCSIHSRQTGDESLWATAFLGTVVTPSSGDQQSVQNEPHPQTSRSSHTLLSFTLPCIALGSKWESDCKDRFNSGNASAYLQFLRVFCIFAHSFSVVRRCFCVSQHAVGQISTNRN